MSNATPGQPDDAAHSRDDDIPAEPGFYLTGHSGLMVLDDDGIWRGTFSDAHVVRASDLPHDLVRVAAVGEGETLTPEEAALALSWRDPGRDADGVWDDDPALIAKLETGATWREPR